MSVSREHKPVSAVAKDPSPRSADAHQTPPNPVWQTLALRPPAIQYKLAISQPDDPYEKEADRVAEQVMRMADPVSDTQPLPFTSFSRPLAMRQCNQCEDEEDKVQRKESGEGGDCVTNAPSGVHETLRSPGQPLDSVRQAFFESRFGYNFSQVRIHNDAQATESAQSINALAYTVGNKVVFDSTLYAPQTGEGMHLMAHELAHVVQQDSGRASSQTLRRTSHGPSTPTNCHNWTIPLPPWIAGTIAHGQISSVLSILPHFIPRATKAGGLLTGIPNPPTLTPLGFADLWARSALVRVAEIKSTATGSSVAATEAAHYQLRHNEWLARGGTSDALDARYLADVGTLLPGGLLDLSAITGTDLILGPFWGDPAKMLHIEGDSAGAVVYWCTGLGMIGSPLWIPVLMRALDDLKKMLQDAMKTLQDAIATAAAAIAAIGRALPGILKMLFVMLLILAIVALLIVAIVCALGIPVTVGATSLCSAAAVGGALTAAVALLLIIGLPATPGLPGATASLFRTLNPSAANAEPESGADYERGTDGHAGTITSPAVAQSTVSNYNPGDDFLNALSPLSSRLSDPLALARSISSSIGSLPSNAVARLNNAVTVLGNMGDTTSSTFIRNVIQSSGLNQPGALAQLESGPVDEALAQSEQNSEESHEDQVIV